MGQVRQPNGGGGVVLLLLALLTAVPGPAFGLPPVRKTPGGAFVTDLGGGLFSVPRGQEIEWTIELCNDTSGPILAQIFDQVHGGDCGPEHQFFTLECPPEITPASAGGIVATCDDALADSLDVADLSVDPAGCVQVLFRTRVDLLADPLASKICNIGFYSTDSEGSGQTTAPEAAFPGCSCVELEPALPTELDLRLGVASDFVPFVGGESSSTAVWQVSADNLTPREVGGMLRVPLPTGLTIVEILECPAGATCSIGPIGEFLVEGLAVAEAGSFQGSFRTAGDCRTFGTQELCAQAIFTPVEDSAATILSDAYSLTPAAEPTCLPVGSEDLSLSVKTWELIDDADGDGVASRDDRVRFNISVFNRGLGPARDVVVTDTIPLGFDRATITVDPTGSYTNPTATWLIDSLGPGSVVDLWLEATLTGNNPCNKARIASRTRLDCTGLDVSTDDPFTLAAEDSTCPDGAGNAAVLLSKSFSFDDADGDGRVTDGELVTLRLELSNPGVLPATGVVLSDTLAACWGDIDLTSIAIEPMGAGTDLSDARQLLIQDVGGPGGLAPGASVVVTLQLPAATAAGCCNQAQVSWNEGPAPTPSDDPRTLGGLPDATCLGLVAAPEAELLKRVEHLDQDGDGVPGTGDRLRYTLTLRNKGTAPLRDLFLSDEIPFELLLDEGSVTTDPLLPLSWRFVPPPGGAFGSGRLEVPSYELQPGEEASLSFETLILGGDEICNRASLAAADLLAPLLSEDEAAGGATCVDVLRILKAELALTLDASGPLTIGCAQPGEEITYALDWAVNGEAETQSSTLTLRHSSKLFVLDADGASQVLPGELSWDLGMQALGSVGSLRPVLAAACDEDAGTSFGADALFTSPEALFDAQASAPALASGRSVLDGTVEIAHDDADANGALSPGEIVTVTVSVDETAGCATTDARVVLSLPPEIVAAVVRDGGVDGGTEIVWEAPGSAALAFIAPGGAAILSADLTLAAGTFDCMTPEIDALAQWPVAPASACPELDSWSELARALPPTDCVAVDPVDLLREDAVTSLGPGGPMPPPASLLDADGGPQGCLAEPPRIDPVRMLAGDVEGELAATGVVSVGDALPVGQGSAGVLVFYEASATCALLKACKVDDDGDPGNGRESVLLTTGARCEP